VRSGSRQHRPHPQRAHTLLRKEKNRLLRESTALFREVGFLAPLGA
jgi:hypothetical protein